MTMGNILKSIELYNKNPKDMNFLVDILTIDLNKGIGRLKASIIDELEKCGIKNYNVGYNDIMRINLIPYYGVFIEINGNILKIEIENKELKDLENKIYIVSENNGVEEKLLVNDFYYMVLLNTNGDKYAGYYPYDYDNLTAVLRKFNNGIADYIVFNVELK